MATHFPVVPARLIFLAPSAPWPLLEEEEDESISDDGPSDDENDDEYRLSEDEDAVSEDE